MTAIHKLNNSGLTSVAPTAKKSLEQIDASNQRITSGKHYLSRSDSPSTALTDRLRGTLIEYKEVVENNHNVKLKIDQQADSVKQIDNIIGEFLVEDSQKIAGRLSTKDIAEKALKKLQNLLESEHDGKKIFGGKDSVGQVLTVDIVKQSNVVNNVATTNFTNVSADEAKVKIGDNEHMRANILFASHPAFSNLFAALHSYKDGGNNKEFSHYFDKFQDHKKEIFIDLGNAKKQIDRAEMEASSRKSEIQQKLTEVEQSDILQETENIRRSGASLKAGADLATNLRRILKDLMERTS